jgi:hypothetical protein
MEILEPFDIMRTLSDPDDDDDELAIRSDDDIPRGKGNLRPFPMSTRMILLSPSSCDLSSHFLSLCSVSAEVA